MILSFILVIDKLISCYASMCYFLVMLKDGKNPLSPDGLSERGVAKLMVKG